MEPDDPLSIRAFRDVLLMHPWLIHAGTTNCYDRPRLMANGMVRIKKGAFDASGVRVLQRVSPG